MPRALTPRINVEYVPESWAQLGLWGSPVVTGARPFVKWVGGKRNLLPVLLPRIPSAIGRYVEPFIGGGAVFLASQHSPAVISDVNPRLIATYRAVRDDLTDLLALLEKHAAANSQDYFYAARDRFNDPDCDGTESASLFIYLNRTCFNGLYRENGAGRFNTPWGKYDDPMIVDADNLRACAAALAGADIRCGSWADITPERGDFWYFDPPYHDTFTKYAKGDFNEDDQAALAQRCREIDAMGGKFLLSNSDTDLIRSLYDGFDLTLVSAQRRVSARADRRDDVLELLVSN